MQFFSFTSLTFQVRDSRTEPGVAALGPAALRVAVLRGHAGPSETGATSSLI